MIRQHFYEFVRIDWITVLIVVLSVLSQKRETRYTIYCMSVQSRMYCNYLLIYHMYTSHRSIIKIRSETACMLNNPLLFDTIYVILMACVRHSKTTVTK